MNRIQCTILLLFWIVACVKGQPDDLSFDAYTSEDYHTNSEIVHAAEDKWGRIWFASNGGGVLIFDGYEFRNLVHLPNDTSTIISNEVLSLYSLGDKMWAGNRYGFSVIDIQNLSVKNYQIGGAFVHSDNRLNNYSEAFVADSNYYWVSANDYLIKLDKKFQKIQHFKLPDIGSPIAKTGIVRLFQDKQNTDRIWIGTLYGLFSYDKADETIIHHKNPPKWHNRSPAIKEYGYWDIAQAKDGTLNLAAMHSGGMMSYHPESEIWTMSRYLEFPGKSPYLGNRVQSVALINDSSFVINMDRGITFIQKGDTYYKEWPGYNLEKYGKSRDSFIDSKGYLWFCADKAILRSKLPVTSTNENNNPQLHTTILNADLNPIYSRELRTQPININLTLTNPSRPKNVEYQYKLCESEWQSIGNRRNIDFFNLDFGHHTIHARAKDLPQSEWIYAEPIEFEVEPPFYLKPLNLVLFGIIILALFFGIWRLARSIIVRQEKLKHEFEKRILETEMKALRSQMNPHFIFNSLNSIYNFILQNETDQAADYLSKFSKLIRRVLNNSKHKNIALVEELHTLQLYLELEKIRIDEKFDFCFHIDSNISAEKVFIPTMLIQPHLENAIWHGIVPKIGSGIIEMKIGLDGDLLKVEITDDGVGRDKSKLSPSVKEKSLGSKITGDRLRLLTAPETEDDFQTYTDLKDEDGNASGTRVILRIPVFTNIDES